MGNRGLTSPVSPRTMRCGGTHIAVQERVGCLASRTFACMCSVLIDSNVVQGRLQRIKRVGRKSRRRRRREREGKGEQEGIAICSRRPSVLKTNQLFHIAPLMLLCLCRAGRGNVLGTMRVVEYTSQEEVLGHCTEHCLGRSRDERQ